METNKDNTSYWIVHFFEKYPQLIILSFVFVLYGNTIMNEYVLDDTIVITENSFVKDGLSGTRDIFSNSAFTGYKNTHSHSVEGGRYRPLSLFTYALEYQLWGLNPTISHLINVLLYALGVLLLLKLMKVLFLTQENSQSIKRFLPLFITALFVAHPIHTEVVANIKGRDEILMFIGVISSLLFSVQFVKTRNFNYLILILFSFFFALMSKENAITFVAVIPLTLFFFTKTKLKHYILVLLPVLISSGIFLYIRFKIVGNTYGYISQDLMNNPFLNASVGEKYATIIYTLGIYLKLLIFPHPLTHDYYPYHIPIVGWSNLLVIFSFLIYLGIGIFALIKLHKRTIYSYVVLYFFVTISIVSNIIINVGTFMNERFLFLSSLGFAIAAAYFLLITLPELLEKQSKITINYQKAFSIFLVILFSAYSIKTISRNTAWKNNTTLFTTDIKTSPNSAKINAAVSTVYFKLAKEQKTEKQKEIYITKAINHARRGLNFHNDNFYALNTLGIIYGQYKVNHDSAVYFFERALKVRPNDYECNYNLGVITGLYKKDYDKGENYLQKAIIIKPTSIDAYKNIGVLYFNKNEFKKALEMFEKGLAIAPNDKGLLNNAGITSKKLGKYSDADIYFSKAK